MATTDRNLEVLDEWLAEITYSSALAPMVELARNLAAKVDGTEWAASTADQYRKTLDRLAERVAEECEGEQRVDIVKLLSTASRPAP